MIFYVLQRTHSHAHTHTHSFFLTVCYFQHQVKQIITGAHTHCHTHSHTLTHTCTVPRTTCVLLIQHDTCKSYKRRENNEIQRETFEKSKSKWSQIEVKMLYKKGYIVCSSCIMYDMYILYIIRLFMWYKLTL